MTHEEYQMLLALPLEVKILKTKQRIREFISQYGREGVYLAFSGGKDSTVLGHLIREVEPSIPFVFCDTGLEFPEIKTFVKSYENTEIIYPTITRKINGKKAEVRLTIKEILTVYGYPVATKKVSRMVKDLQNPTPRNERTRKMYLSPMVLDQEGNPTKERNKDWYLAPRWHKLIDSPYKISGKCCDKLKKEPFKRYNKKTDRHPFVATLAAESRNRLKAYIKTGCNNFKERSPQSQPLSFWSEQDIYTYIVENNIQLASVYGEVVKDEATGKYYTTGIERSGCMFCMLGAHKEAMPNRFLQLEKSHPKIHEYCMKDLGFEPILNFLEIPCRNKD